MDEQDVKFANVQFEIETLGDSADLLKCLAKDIRLSYRGKLENGREFVSFSLQKPFRTIEATIAAFCSMIERLPSSERDVWERCEERRIDIGCESGNTERALSSKIAKDTVRRVSEIGADIVITIYPISMKYRMIRL
jgi:hypothetical protein